MVAAMQAYFVALMNGLLHDANDVDVYFFRSEDAGGGTDFWGDTSRTSVTLVDGPPGLALCAQLRDKDAGCGGYTDHFESALCGQQSYAHDGHTGSEDSQDVTFWMVWRPGAAPVCQTYMVKLRGRE